MEFRNEKQVADAAVRKLESALRSKTSGFASHYRGDPADKSMKDATAFAKVKKYGKGRGNIKRYMTSLSIRMTKYGFIQHFGIDNIRQSGTRFRSKPKETTYNFAAHYFKMKAQPFINSAIDQSGVIPFVMENITKLRSEELIYEIKNVIERHR